MLTQSQRIRTVEKNLNINANDYLHIQTMDKNWGSGDPTEAVDNLYYAASTTTATSNGPTSTPRMTATSAPPAATR